MSTEESIRPGYLHYARLTTVTFEKFFAKWKERWIWDTVVLKNNRLLDLLKYPIKAASNSEAASYVCFRKVPQQFAGPINFVDNATNVFTGLRLARSVRAWSISDNDQSMGFHRSDPFEDNLCSIRAVEDKKNDRYFKALVHRYEDPNRELFAATFGLSVHFVLYRC